LEGAFYLAVLHEVAADSALFVDFKNTAAASSAPEAICTDDALVGILRARGLQSGREFSFARLAGDRVEAILRVIIG
jgi:hypothetical protein